MIQYWPEQLPDCLLLPLGWSLDRQANPLCSRLPEGLPDPLEWSAESAAALHRHHIIQSWYVELSAWRAQIFPAGRVVTAD